MTSSPRTYSIKQTQKTLIINFVNKSIITCTNNVIIPFVLHKFIKLSGNVHGKPYRLKMIKIAIAET